MDKPTHEVTVVLDNGAILCTEATYEQAESPEGYESSPADELLDYIVNDRSEGAWKTIGEVTAFHRRIIAFKLREL